MKDSAARCSGDQRLGAVSDYARGWTNEDQGSMPEGVEVFLFITVLKPALGRHPASYSKRVPGITRPVLESDQTSNYCRR
jgi:hypothetical protein